MANRAYLFSCDRNDPDIWREWDREGAYCDSRWCIPLSWFFFFRVSDIVLVDVHFMSSDWQEVKFVAKKDDALKAFADRQQLLLDIIGEQYDSGIIGDFLERIRSWRGIYLLMDPEEVFGGISEAEHWQLTRSTRILERMGAEHVHAQDIVDIIPPYARNCFDDKEQLVRDLVGYTYSI